MIMVTHESLGTVVAIVPFNAPMLLYSYKAVSYTHLDVYKRQICADKG